ncbi:hypothetical protein CPB97_008606 [Podila verticillata]|nr:hypothetical protein CPB97_008606 [Podila verticillata]
MPFANVITNPTFWKTMFQQHRYTDKDIPDLSGKVAIVTGANTGLGYATTVALASHGARVFLACRSRERALEAIERAKVDIAQLPNAVENIQLDFLELDLNSMASCHRAAKEFVKLGLPLHILINNGGVMTTPFALSADGIEQQFAINHLGHFVFTLGLLDKLKESQPSRIVVLSSIGHESSVKGGVDFDTLNDPNASNTASRYGRSKLSNILFAKALARRLANEKVYVNALHPGFVYTDLQRNTQASMGKIASIGYDLAGRISAASPTKGAYNQLFCATSPEIEEKDYRGLYFMPTGIEFRPSPYASDEELQEKLWTYSETVFREKVKEP